MTKKSQENEILAKGNYSCISESNTTKVELDLYYVKTNSYAKFREKITNDERVKSGKTKFLQRAITEVNVDQS